MKSVLNKIEHGNKPRLTLLLKFNVVELESWRVLTNE